MFELIFQLLFWGGIVGLVVWLARRDQRRQVVDYDSKSYAQGYWDGYRAHQKQVGEPVDAVPSKTAEELTFRPPNAHDSVVASDKTDPKQKEKHDAQNINLALYVASFLLVAAAALFIGTGLPGGVKFVATWLITVAFYAVGLLLYDKITKLRPAAVAFTGTGLALLPFTGLAMYNFVLPDAALCWLITSLIGVAVYVYATMRLQSQVIAYFAIAFMISLATASVATLGAGLLWYFVVLVGFGAMVTSVASIKPKWLPVVFSAPIQQGGQWIVPLTLAVSLATSPFLRLLDYEVISFVGLLYYVALAFSRSADRDLAVFAARLLANVFVVLVAFDLADSLVVAGYTLAATGILQSLISAKLRRGALDSEAWLWLGFGVQVFAPLLVLASDNWALHASLLLLLLLASSLGISLRRRQAALLFFGVYAGVVLPFAFVGSYLELTYSTEVIAVIFALMGAAAVAVRWRLVPRFPSLGPVTVAAYVGYLVLALAASISAAAWLAAVVWALAAAAVYGLAGIEKQPWLMVVANGVLFGAFGWLLAALGVADEWRGMILAWLAGVSFYGMYWMLQERGVRDTRYGRAMFWSGLLAAGIISLLNLGNANDDIVVAASLTVIVSGLALALEAENRRRLAYYDAAVILGTIGLQRLVALAWPEADGLVYSHWWALVFAALAYVYYRARQPGAAKPRLIIGLAVLSFFSGVAALSMPNADVPYRLIFLVEHAVLLIAGLVLQRKLLSIWGAVGVVLAVLWLLSGYTFLLLLLIGLGLIAGAVYALLKKSGDVR